MVTNTLTGFIAVLLASVILLAFGFVAYAAPANRYSVMAIRLWVRTEVAFLTAFFFICALAGCYQIGAVLRGFFL